MPDPLTIASTALGVIKGIGDFFGAKSDEEKAIEERDKLKQPFYKIQDEYVQNRNIAANLAGSGLPDATKNYLTTEGQRGLATSISGNTQNGGTPNDSARLLDIYNNSIDRTAEEDANARVSNIHNFMTYNKDLAGQKTMKWTLDEYQPYQRKLKEITERIGAAKINKNNALNESISSLSSGGTALSNNDLMKQLFAGNNVPAGNYVAPANPTAITSESVRTPGATIQPVNLQLGNQSQGQGVNVFDPNVNPYGEGAYFDGTQWIP